MPVPRFSTYLKEGLDRPYDLDDIDLEALDREMAKWGKTRENFTYQHISLDQRLNAIICTTYEVNPSRFSCNCLGGSKYTYAECRGAQVFISCGYCRCTYGPITVDVPAIQILGKRRVSVKEARKILKETKQNVVGELKKLLR